MKSLMECQSTEAVVELPRDNFSKDEFHLVCDGNTVWLSEQRLGDNVAQSIEIPKNVFDSLVKKYIQPQGALPPI